MVTAVLGASTRSLPPGEGGRTGARSSHMTGPFLPRPSPDHDDTSECDSNGHLRGQDGHLLINHADQEGHDREGGGYISRQGRRGKTLYQINSNHTHARQTQGQSPLHL